MFRKDGNGDRVEQAGGVRLHGLEVTGYRQSGGAGGAAGGHGGVCVHVVEVDEPYAGHEVVREVAGAQSHAFLPVPQDDPLAWRIGV